MLKPCQRPACGGSLYLDDDGFWTCLRCARVANPITPLPWVRNVKIQGPAFGVMEELDDEDTGKSLLRSYGKLFDKVAKPIKVSEPLPFEPEDYPVAP